MRLDSGDINPPSWKWTMFPGKDAVLALLGILLSSTFHFAYFLSDSEHISPDSPSYLEPAISILKGKGFVGSNGLPETMRTPGYPLFLAVCMALGMGVREIVILQHTLAAILAGGVYYLARRLGASRGFAFLPCLLYGIDFPSLHGANRILTETLFTLLFFPVFWLALKWTMKEMPVRPFWGAVVGGLGGLSALVRPISLFYIVPLSVALWVSGERRRILNLLIMTVAFAISPIMWALRNQEQAGVFTLSSITGETLLFWRAAGVLAIKEKGEFDANRALQAERLREIAAERVAANGLAELATLPHARKAEVYSQLAKEILLAHPWGTLLLTVRGAAVILLRGGGAGISALTGLPRSLSRFLGAIYGSMCFLFFLLGIRMLWRENPHASIFLAMTVAYFVLMPAGGEASPRFRVPIVPCYAVCISIGLGKAMLLASEKLRSLRGVHVREP
jgi:hypothetical protein